MKLALVVGRTIIVLVITAAGLALIFDAFRGTHNTAEEICEVIVGLFLVLCALSASPHSTSGSPSEVER